MFERSNRLKIVAAPHTAPHALVNQIGNIALRA